MSAGLADEDPQMVAAFDVVYLIRLDADEWGWDQVAPGFNVDVIPLFYRLDSAGHPTGNRIDGGAWGPDTYPNISSVMDPWIHRP